jgi:hypothetical protein
VVVRKFRYKVVLLLNLQTGGYKEKIKLLIERAFTGSDLCNIK